MPGTIGLGMLICGFMANALQRVRHLFPGELEPRMRVICGTDSCRVAQAVHQYRWDVHAVRDFLDCLKGDSASELGFTNGLKLHAVLEAVQNAARLKTWQSL